MTLDVIEQTLTGVSADAEQDQPLTTLGGLSTPAAGTKWVVKRAFSNLLFGPATIRTTKSCAHGIYVVRQPGAAFVAAGIKTGDGYYICQNTKALPTTPGDTGSHSSVGGPTNDSSAPFGTIIFSDRVEIYPGEIPILRIVAFDGDTGVASVTLDIQPIDVTLPISIPAQSVNVTAPAQSVGVTTADTKVGVTVDAPAQPATVAVPATLVSVNIPAQVVNAVIPQ
jgi:hypothetical protein